MNLTPEILGALRILLMIGGTALFIKPGWLDMPMLEQIVGAILTLGAAGWAMYAKRSVSKEGQIIAGRVESNPDTQPIMPSSPLDEKTKDAHL
jgi:hypothetical protein